MATVTIELSAVADLYDRGLYLQAYRAAQELGPFQEWPGTEGRILAGRLIGNLNAPRLARMLHVRAWREDPDNPLARYYYARALLDRRGPFKAWKFIEQDRELSDAPAGSRADWLALVGFVHGLFRDFPQAHERLAQAEALSPSSPWLCVERAALLEREDRRDEALQAAQRSLQLQPWFRPGVQMVAHLLQQLDHDHEALALLSTAADQIESFYVVVQLADLQSELGDHAAARSNYELLAREYPVLEQKSTRWLAARRSNAAYHCGDFEESRRLAEESKEPFFTKIAEALAAAKGDERRVQLPVGFVRQNYLTCAPATLSAISRFWSMPAEHLDVADEICYDGTPSFRERQWADENGWVAREFTVTWESAVALLDRGVPFTLTTVEPTNAHLQAAIGYDARRRTLLVRDPSARNFTEFLAEPMFERYRSTGPRGMALVPRDKAALLEGIDLPDAAPHDQLYVVQRALESHDRDAAQAAYDAMRASDPRHRLTLMAHRVLTSYDADTTGLLACTDALLELYPDDGIHQLTRLSCLRQMARRDERLTLLESVCKQPNSDPAFWQQHAEELLGDARQHERVHALLSRALRARPLEAMNYFLLGNLLWDQRRFAEALPMYRFAACLEDKQERFAWAFFVATRHLKRTDEGLALLRERFARFGERSGWPCRTLFSAYADLDRMGEAFEVLENALRMLPEDGDLLLYAADAFSRNGNRDRAEALLAEARPKARRGSWLRSAAEMARWRGDLRASLELWKQVLELEPLAGDAHRSVVLLLAETQGLEAALAHLEQAAGRFPHSYAVHQLWVEWLRDGDPVQNERVLRRLVDIDPVDAWTQRELSIVLARQQRLDEALSAAEVACRCDPDNPSSWTTRAHVQALRGSLEEAKEDLRASLRLSVDNDYAMRRLLDLCDTSGERREELRFVQEQLVRQVNFGEGLLAFHNLAQGTLEPDEVLTVLREGLAARRDLWHAWSAAIRQLESMKNLDEALQLARLASERFPLVPGAWLDLASACNARNDRDGAVEALRRALEINPGWGRASRQLAETLIEANDLEQAKVVLDQAVARTPLEAANHGMLADVLWQLNQREAAVERLEKALAIESEYDWAWSTLRSWCAELGRSDRAVELARELTVRRAGDAHAWLVLADALAGGDGWEERLAALDRAVALNPQNVQAHDQRAELLAALGRFDDALLACRPTALGDPPPLLLRGRAAWVIDRRGDRDEAIRQMRRLVEEDADYYWAWSQLTMWYDERREEANYREAAESLVRLAPTNPWSWGCLGDAKLRTDDRAGGETAFRHALELGPDYTFAASSLLDLLVDDNRLDDAAQLFDHLKLDGGDAGYVLARRVRVEALRGNMSAALEAFQLVCTCPTDNRWVIDAPFVLLREKGWESSALKVIESSLASPDANPHLAAAWVDAFIQQGRIDELNRRLNPQNWTDEAAWAEAASEYLGGLVRAKRQRECRRFVKSYRELLRRNAVSWGAVGSVLHSMGDVKGTIQWLADWHSREGVQPWMLLNLALSQRQLKRDAEAAEVSRAALDLPPDHCSASHLLWLASDLVCVGSIDEVAARIEGIDDEQLGDYYKGLHALLRGMIEARRVGQSGTASYRQVRRPLQEAIEPYLALMVGDPQLSRLRRRCFIQLAGDFGGPLARAGARLGIRDVRDAVTVVAVVVGAVLGVLLGVWSRSWSGGRH